jgi:Zn finger protein HypA/HybF involved in hydrogenase expression
MIDTQRVQVDCKYCGHIERLTVDKNTPMPKCAKCKGDDLDIIKLVDYYGSEIVTKVVK